MSTLSSVQKKLQSQKSELGKKYGVKTIAIFGSVSRGEDTEGSDIDILVDFNKPIGIEFINLADELESMLGKKVDLVTRGAIKPRYFKAIEKELKYV